MNRLTHEQKMKLVDIFMYGSFALFFLWMILKIAGIIQTPLWLKLFPYYSVVFGFVVFIYKMGDYLGSLKTDLKYMKRSISSTQKNVSLLNEQVSGLDKRMSSLDVRMSRLDVRMNGLEHSFERHIVTYHK